LGEDRESLRSYWTLLKRTIEQWQRDNVSRMAAALAYFTAISIAPMSLLIIVIAGFLWGGERAARAEFLHYVQNVIGPEGAAFVDMVVQNADRPTFGSIAGVIGAVTLIWGATSVFTQLQSTLNIIWNVSEKSEENGVVKGLRRRFFSFAMVLVIAFLLLVSLALSTALQTAIRTVQASLPGGDWLWQIGNFIGWLFTTFLFAAIFKMLPDAEIAWREVWSGAALTALLFGFGRFVLSFYLAHIGSSYGVAGSMIAFLIWVYFSAQIVFLGAEFTQVYGTTDGPASN
jgi:membrane protein